MNRLLKGIAPILLAIICVQVQAAGGQNLRDLSAAALKTEFANTLNECMEHSGEQGVADSQSSADQARQNLAQAAAHMEQVILEMERRAKRQMNGVREIAQHACAS